MLDTLTKIRKIKASTLAYVAKRDDGELYKVEYFDTNHKLYHSIQYHKDASSHGCNVPFFDELITHPENKFVKISEWFDDPTLWDYLVDNPNDLEETINQLAFTIIDLRSIGLCPVDSHFYNFVVNDSKVYYVDMKKLLPRDDWDYQAAKIVLKQCRGKTKWAHEFLRAYKKYTSIDGILKICKEHNWQVKCINGTVYKIKEFKND